MEIPGGMGGSTKTPLEWKFLRGGGCKPRNLPWERYGYFREPHNNNSDIQQNQREPNQISLLHLNFFFPFIDIRFFHFW